MQTLDGQLMFDLPDDEAPMAVGGPYRELLTTAHARRKLTTRRYRVELRPEPVDDANLDRREKGCDFA